MMKNTACLLAALLLPGHALAGHPVAFEVQLLAVDANEGIAVADYDNDGRLDISAGRNWYRNPGPGGTWAPRPVRHLGERNEYAESNGEHAIDIDQDGWTDILSCSFFDTPLTWYRNPGGEALSRGWHWPGHVLADLGQNTNEFTMLFDFDHKPDGRPEFVANQWDNNKPLIVWRFAQPAEGGDPGQPRMVPHKLGDHSGHGMGVGDINNDGREDIIVATGWYERPEGDPYATQWVFHAQWQGQFCCPILIRDIDGDGLTDMVAAKGHDYGVYVWFGKGVDEEGKPVFDKITVDESFSQPHAVQFADLDGDGVDELITGKRVRAHNGHDPGGNEPPIMVYYAWDAGSHAYQRYVINEGEVGIGLQIRTADLDGDGDVEIVVAGKEGTQILWNQGD